jgi:hypothetical protein
MFVGDHVAFRRAQGATPGKGTTSHSHDRTLRDV